MTERGLYLPNGEFESRDDITRRGKDSLFDHAIDIFQHAQRFDGEYHETITEAIWNVTPENPYKPIRLLMGTDFHYGNIQTDYDLMKKHLDIVEQTPNTYLITNGDHVDNFNTAGAWATGVYENPLPPQAQMKAFIERMERLDSKGKIGVMSFGNHDNFIDITGYDWLESFAKNLKAPLFTTGGMLHILVGTERYDLALTHRYWGSSRLNPTNVCKRFMEHEWPNADVIFLGHTHQSEILTFERGGKERVALIGGTYKMQDKWARQKGIGGRGGHPGMAVLLYPRERKVTGFKHIEDSL